MRIAVLTPLRKIAVLTPHLPGEGSREEGRSLFVCGQPLAAHRQTEPGTPGHVGERENSASPER